MKALRPGIFVVFAVSATLGCGTKTGTSSTGTGGAAGRVGGSGGVALGGGGSQSTGGATGVAQTVAGGAAGTSATVAKSGGAAGTSATVAGSGGATSIGSGGSGGGGVGGLGGGAGGAKDAAAFDGAREAADAVADVALGCQGGHPAGTQWPLGDGCNTCYCSASGGTYFCTTADCSRRDSACAGEACGGIDSVTSKPDVAVLDSASVGCSTVTAQDACDSRSDCHSVFTDPGTCGCVTPGCCMRFSRCVDGSKALCTQPSAIACTIATPLCSGQYVLAYTATCYEGCVLSKACGP